MADIFGNKTGGRKKGSLNKVKNNEVRDYIKEHVAIYSLIEDIRAIDDPYRRARAKMELIEFVVPKLKTIDYDVTLRDEDAGKIEITYTVAQPEKDQEKLEDNFSKGNES